MMTADVPSLCAELRDRIARAAPGLLDDYPTESYIAALDGDQRWGLYQYLPDEVRRYRNHIDAQHGREVLEDYQRLVLATLARDVEGRLEGRCLPDSVRELLFEYVERAVSRLAKDRGGANGFYLPTNDVFAKQVCVARLRLLPVGPEVVDPLSSVPRSLFVNFGARQCLRSLWFFGTRTRGIKPFYTFHTDRTLAAEFNPEGYDRAYLRVAELLELNPQMKGLVGKSWFYDPKLEEISPELAYLRTGPVDNGAVLLDDHADESAVKGALRFSKARNEAYDRGDYSPAYHWIMWARRDLLAWARRFRSSQEAKEA